ncbi:MAG: hypothetical protein AB8G15_15365 [Saprospiraceae bacterium]
MENNNYPLFPKNRKPKTGEAESPPLARTPEPAAQDLDFDQAFKQQFNQFERTPPPHIWTEVSKEIPFHLLLKRHLQRLSKIAAILLIGMTITVVFQQKGGPLLLPSSATLTKTTKSEKTVIGAAEANPDFVYDHKVKRKTSTTRQQQKRIKHSADLEELWAEIMKEEQNTAADLLAHSVILPLEILPLENHLTALPTNIKPPTSKVSSIELEDVPVELEIRIPLKIESYAKVE